MMGLAFFDAVWQLLLFEVLRASPEQLTLEIAVPHPDRSRETVTSRQSLARELETRRGPEPIVAGAPRPRMSAAQIASPFRTNFTDIRSNAYEHFGQIFSVYLLRYTDPENPASQSLAFWNKWLFGTD
jgi:hypothetical protein